MSFKFNFSNDVDDSPEPGNLETPLLSSQWTLQADVDRFDNFGQSSKEGTEWVPCECLEIIPNINMNLDSLTGRVKMFLCGDLEIGHVIAKEAIVKAGTLADNGLKNAIELAEKEHSDLVPGKYEGGFKIWECTDDLLCYLIPNPDDIGYENTKVLDLGCGAGILGIYAFMFGSHVTFQDYNKEVLEYLTIPNVLLNMEDEENRDDIKNCKFYSGDWISFNKKLDPTEVFDVILTSETIYNPANYNKLIHLFVQRLTIDGIAYVAAKTHYFGVGGGMRQFEAEVKNSGILECIVCWKSQNSEGIQREILKVTRRDVFII